MELPKITVGEKDEEIRPLPRFTGFGETFMDGPPTDGEAPLNPEQGRKVAGVDFEIIGLRTAAADTGTPSDEGGNELAEKYRRSALDVTVLRDHLALRGDVALQAQSISHDLRSRMRDMEQELHHERLDRKDVSADLTRQYKTMQTDMTVKVKKLGDEAILLREQLAQCQEELRAERKAHEQLQQEKDTTIADLQNKLDNMETDYEKILHDTLDSLTSQLAEARLRWEHESTVVHQEYKELLSDFGLNSLDI
ncbi:coiled-coil domain-containing protein 153 [Salvelinus namaycush]|uniref:Dynein regulatory complex protein 12 n=1 Tax=Salvelinus namaycush TaxID=8040 RepID=A0A8U0P456_SALNM|nr:coiled-coil domain-containing protein 153 [Salvelinus namaycush]